MKNIILSLFFSISIICKINSQNLNVIVVSYNLNGTINDELNVTLKERTEKYLIEHPFINLLDRDLHQRIEKERMIQRSESFIDGFFIEQGKAIGANILLEVVFVRESRKVIFKFINIEKGNIVLINEYSLDRFLNTQNNVERPDFFDRFLKEKVKEMMAELDVSSYSTILVIDISKHENNKAQKVIIKCNDLCNLKKGSKLSVNVAEQATSNLITKMKKIGTIEIIYKENNSIFEAAVLSGKEDIYNYINAKQNLKCIYEK